MLNVPWNKVKDIISVRLVSQVITNQLRIVLFHKLQLK